MLILSLPTLAQEEDAFSKDVRKYLDINGTKESFPIVMDQMIGQIKGVFPSVPANYWQEFQNEMKEVGLEDLYTDIIPIYKKHFTHEDIKKIIEFYESPTGKKLSQKTPEITQESIMVGQKWGMMISQKIVQKLEEKGYKKI
jgi:uncharacterized protein